jgi:hypothetical protein
MQFSLQLVYVPSFLKDTFLCKFHDIKIVPTSQAEIKSIILSLKSNNSSGCDENMSKIMKTYASLVSQLLSHIYNHSLYKWIFPDCLNISVVKPLFKKGDKLA